MKTKSLCALAIPFLLGCNGGPNDNSANGGQTSAALSADNGQGQDQGGNNQGDDHVLLISIDGMHQNDLELYVANHPSSTFATLIHSGSEYTNAAASNPSDSDPGGTALMTGGNPRSTGG